MSERADRTRFGEDAVSNHPFERPFADEIDGAADGGFLLFFQREVAIEGDRLRVVLKLDEEVKRRYRDAWSS